MPALLFTKFFLPAPRHKQVARSGILDALETGLRQGRSLTLISAPAGYGKSVAAAEWLHTLTPSPLLPGDGQGVRAAWLSLDEADNEPGRFFTYFVAALRQKDESFCPELFAALHAGQTLPVWKRRPGGEDPGRSNAHGSTAFHPRRKGKCRP